MSDDETLHLYLAMSLVRTDQVEGSVAHCHETIRLKPDNLLAFNALTWILATNADDRVRDADTTVQLARRATNLTGQKNAAFLDTVAAAYASAGRFDQAVATAHRSLELAKASSADTLAKEIGDHLQRYRQSKPYCEPNRTLR